MTRSAAAWTFAIGIALTAAGIMSFRATYDPDLFWHLAQGREVAAGHLVRTNLFNPAFANYPQPYASWAFEAVLYVGVTRFGDAFLPLFQCGLLAASFATLFATARRAGGSAAAFAVLLISVWIIEPRAMPRPYLVSFVGMSLVAGWTWVQVTRHTSHVTSQRSQVTNIKSQIANSEYQVSNLIYPILVLICWSNFHSESVFAVAFLVVAGVLATNVTVLVAGVLGALATLVTPYGIGMWTYLLENARVPVALRIAELQPPSLVAYPAFFVYLAVLVLALALAPRRLRAWEVAVALIFGALGLRYIRFTPVVVFATAPIVADRLRLWIDRGWDRRAVMVTAFAVAAATMPASPRRMIDALRFGTRAVEPADVFSQDARSFIAAHALRGPVFNSMNLGGWLSWSFDTDVGVFQDSRLQAVPPEHFDRIVAASSNPTLWKAMVAPVDWAVLSTGRPNDISGVGKFDSAEWAAVFRDRAVEILLRRNGRYAELAQRLEMK